MKELSLTESLNIIDVHLCECLPHGLASPLILPIGLFPLMPASRCFLSDLLADEEVAALQKPNHKPIEVAFNEHTATGHSDLYPSQPVETGNAWYKLREWCRENGFRSFHTSPVTEFDLSSFYD